MPPHWRLAISERSLISKKCKTDQRGVYHPFFLSACYNYKNPAQGGKIYTQLRKLLHLQPTSSFERIPPSQRRAQIFYKMQSIGSILDRKALSIRREYLVCRLCRFDIVFGPHLDVSGSNCLRLCLRRIAELVISLADILLWAIHRDGVLEHPMLIC